MGGDLQGAFKCKKCCSRYVWFTLCGIICSSIRMGFSVNFDLITCGRDAGFHASDSTFLRLGGELDVSGSIVNGNYQDPVKDISYESVMGLGSDSMMAFGPYSYGVWTSLTPNLTPTWTGSGIGLGLGFGASVGATYTKLLR